MDGANLIIPVLTGSFAFVGVLVAQLVIVWMQRSKVLAEDMRRWHSERRSLYAQFMAHAREIDDKISDAANEDDPRELPNIHDRNSYRLGAIEDEIMLIAPHSVVVAARKLSVVLLDRTITAWQLAGDDCLGDLAVDENNAEELAYQSALRVATTDFIETARQDLINPLKIRSVKRRIFASREEIARWI
ncbi:hypothetical protein ACFXPA_28690 [Amycolatopsis sp. NPDC059090]|uniref:hypothetical protein n=1 Tax=unclassified Amycolatopsis TaxID=2618356 RepID=UPI003670C275